MGKRKGGMGEEGAGMRGRDGMERRGEREG